MKHVFKYRFLYLGLFAVTLTACGGGSSGSGSGPTPVTPVTCTGGTPITVTWAANKETAVNMAGGGYIVYFSASTGFNPGDANVCSQAVPYVMGALAPTTTIIHPSAGTLYVRIAATSALDAPGTTGGSESVASAQTTVAVP